MRQIRIAELDERRPVLLLTRDVVIPHRARVTVAPITSTIRGLASEVPVGPDNGLDHESVVSCDNIATIHKDALGRVVGHLLAHQENELTNAIRAAFDLEPAP
ncbi:MAG: type II toxin-antitoxin system PemK/MazF family toxin [Micromonosporaceae bacterium]